MMYSDNGGKKIGLALILVGLMLVIISFGKYFEESLKVATLTQNNMVSFKQYEILEGEITYKLPMNWISAEKVSRDSSEIYNNEFVSEDTSIYGSIEVVNGSNGVVEVMEQCIAEIKDMGVQKYDRNTVNINQMSVGTVEYDIRFTNNSIKHVYEYYIPYENNMVKVTFIISDEKARENTNVVFENIVKTFSFDN